MLGEISKTPVADTWLTCRVTEGGLSSGFPSPYPQGPLHVPTVLSTVGLVMTHLTCRATGGGLPREYPSGGTPNTDSRVANTDC
jgi:hypothetical protein